MGSLRPPVDVMLARAVLALPPAFALPGGVQYEHKWGGYRLVAFTSPRPHLQSRRGADLTVGFPEIAEAVATLPDVVVDGELVIWGDGALDFRPCCNAWHRPALGTATATASMSSSSAPSPAPSTVPNSSSSASTTTARCGGVGRHGRRPPLSREQKSTGDHSNARMPTPR